MAPKDFKDFINHSEPNYQTSGGVLAQALSLTEAEEEQQRICGLSCGETITLFICICRVNGTSLRWLKRLVIRKWPVHSHKNPSI